ncbi:MAG: glycosyl hydrolase [Bacteroidia bacterium]|nr:glycosyl hydrolase [Bacteroidia bacterium]
MKKLLWILMLVPGLCINLHAQKKKKQRNEETKVEQKSKINAALLSSFKFRAVGPALTSGRVADIAVNPNNYSEYYVATASGGVWKTTNHGTTFKPIFDSQGSYSTACVTIDPNNSHVVWVGTGENNGQRSIAYGDGVYKSIDGGKSWKNMGLKSSEHIGNIVVDPRNSDVVFVAAHGPLWSEGGERGLYKTEDGGKTWACVLEISDKTGINEVHMDPRNPDIMYASAWQRSRRVWTFLGGGPESAIYKSTDGGKTWNKSQRGLPSGDLGRIGMDISPVNPNVIYAIVEASGKKGGFFRSTDMGVTWSKMNPYSTSGNYYQEIICDPKDVDKVYIMNTYAQITRDGGKTIKAVGERNKHVDNHCVWINPKDTRHMIMGCDGGLYESYDDAKTWNYKSNLSITQFYKVTTDNAEPFYNIYGGTQDNYSLGGPSRTTSASGIVNSDWFVTRGGDGFESAVDPENPNIVYAQAQYGALARFDKKSGESISIKPMERKDEAAYRFNWDAPLFVSPHKSSRLYFAANKVFRSEDRGNTWKVISEDLSRQLDRNKLEVQGRVWSMDAVAKNRSTSIYGNIVALDESPLKEDLIYAGTDDGLIHVTENGGESWTKIESVDGVPEMTYVNMLLTSQHDEATVYAVFNNHKKGDFKPYVYKSTDKGKSWKAISSDLPERGSAYSIAEDHVDPNLLFVGTEFGLFVSMNGGENWLQMKSGLPTIAIRDIAVQKRENDLVLASFGRGFFVLDDYSGLRNINEELVEKEAAILPVKDALWYVESRPLGGSGKAYQGSSYFFTPNPKVGATFTYYLKESLTTAKQKRQKEERKLIKDGKPVYYPSAEEIRNEDNEIAPYLLFTIKDSKGKIVNRLRTSAGKGLKKMVWDYSFPSPRAKNGKGEWSNRGFGHRAGPGTYTVSMGKVVDEVYTELVPAVEFKVKSLDNSTLPAKNTDAVVKFQRKVDELARAVSGAEQMTKELGTKVNAIKSAVAATATADISMLADARKLEKRLMDVSLKLEGDRSLSRREFETPPSISARVGNVLFGLYRSTSEPTATFKDAYEIAAEEFKPVYQEIKDISKAVTEMENKLDKLGAPYTPGRLPGWEKE